MTQGLVEHLLEGPMRPHGSLTQKVLQIII